MCTEMNCNYITCSGWSVLINAGEQPSSSRHPQEFPPGFKDRDGQKSRSPSPRTVACSDDSSRFRLTQIVYLWKHLSFFISDPFFLSFSLCHFCFGLSGQKNQSPPEAAAGGLSLPDGAGTHRCQVRCIKCSIFQHKISPTCSS